MYKHRHSKRLREKLSRNGKNSQRIQALKREAQSGQWETFEDICGRAKDDQKGQLFDVWTKTSLAYVEIFHSLNRSDQFDLVIYEPKKWSEGHKQRRINALSMPKLLKVWADIS